jgi:hypothetical protein
MYVRIARFEGGTPAQIEEEGARIQRDLKPAGGGQSTGEVPTELARLASRIEMLVDRDQGSVAMIVYAKDEQRIREIDRIMNAMSPTSGEWGRRVSVDIYQVYLDEAPGVARAA